MTRTDTGQGNELGTFIRCLLVPHSAVGSQRGGAVCSYFRAFGGADLVLGSLVPQ